MEYLTVRETAKKWGLSDLMVQQFCIDGRISGAQRIGSAWAIPAEAEKPQVPQFLRGDTQTASALLDDTCLMPLMNTPFRPGEGLAAVESMIAGPQRDIARAEYHYFSGRPELAAKGGGALSHQHGYGGAALRLPDLRLCQPSAGAYPAGAVRAE